MALSGSEIPFTSAHTVAEREASIENAKTSAKLRLAIGLTEEHILAISGANSPSSGNVYATMVDIPEVPVAGTGADEYLAGNDSRIPSTDQKAAMSGTAGAPSASNPYATKSTTDAQATALSAKAPLTSPTFTGTPSAPTAAASTNTTQVATTAFTVREVATEAATRLAADIETAGGRRLVSARNFTGGYSTFAANAARAGFLGYGTSVMSRLCASGAGTLADMGSLKVELTDSDGSYARVQVSLVLASGTLVCRSSARVMPLGKWRRLGVLVDAPVSGSLSASSVHVYVENTAAELETMADFSGAPVSGTGAWTLCADAAGTNPLTCRVASDGWHALNYPLSSAQWADWLATGRLPYDGAGTMQVLSNGSFETFTGTADDGNADTFAGWTSTYTTGKIEAVSADVGYACKVTNGASASSSISIYVPQSGKRVVISARSKGDGTYAGLWRMASAILSGYLTDTDGLQNITTGNTTGTWTTVKRTFDIPITASDARLYLGPPFAADAPNGSAYWDDVTVCVMGDLLAGLDLAAQPVCSRTCDGSVLSDSPVGVRVVGPGCAPDLIHSVSGLQMLMDGTPFASGVVAWPKGYSVSSAYATNIGSTSASLTLRATGATGAILATGTVDATSVPVPLTLTSANVSALFSTGGTFYLGGVAGTIIRLKVQLTKG